MPITTSFLTLLVFVIAYVPLALADNRSLPVRACQAIVAVGVILCLGLFFGSVVGEPERLSDRSAAGVRLPSEVTAVDRASRVEAPVRWAARAVGCWVALLAASELLRLVLKRSAGAELLGPSVVFLAGVLLLDPGWAVGLGFALLVTGAVALAVWRPTDSRGKAEPGDAPDPAR